MPSDFYLTYSVTRHLKNTTQSAKYYHQQLFSTRITLCRVMEEEEDQKFSVTDKEKRIKDFTLKEIRIIAALRKLHSGKKNSKSLWNIEVQKLHMPQAFLKTWKIRLWDNGSGWLLSDTQKMLLRFTDGDRFVLRFTYDFFISIS